MLFREVSSGAGGESRITASNRNPSPPAALNTLGSRQRVAMVNWKLDLRGHDFDGDDPAATTRL
jgi:hypothetical protein